MEIYAYLVDWDRLESEWAPHAEEPQWGQLVDEANPWVKCPQVGVSDSASWNSDIGDAFWNVADHLDGSERQSLGTFLSAFALSIREDDDEEEFETPFEFSRTLNYSVASSLSPATVNTYLQLADNIPIDKVVAIADEVIQDSGGDLESGESFREFINEWQSVLNEAKELGFGVIVSIAG